MVSDLAGLVHTQFKSSRENPLPTIPLWVRGGGINFSGQVASPQSRTQQDLLW